MKKISSVIILALLVINFIIFDFNVVCAEGEVSYTVSGAGTSAVNGTYVESGTNADKPKYVFGDYILGYSGVATKWVIGSGDWWEMSYFYYTETEGDTPPSTGWTRWAGEDPIPSVLPSGPSLSYSDSGIFQELENHNGSMAAPLTITYTQNDTDSFSGENGIFSTDNYSVNNIPTGLGVMIIKNSDTELSFLLTKKATNHDNSDQVYNLEITFNDSAFKEGDASVVTNVSKSDIGIEFFQSHTVCASGCDFPTISIAIASSTVEDDDDLRLSAEAYTGYFTINKAVSIYGQGAGSTIIQAHADYDTATTRVIFIPEDISYVKLYDLTVRNGASVSSREGGGIYAGSPLYVYNCIVKNNIIKWSGDTTWIRTGGGIYSDRNILHIENSLIQGNKIESTDGSSDERGGGLYKKQGELVLVNTTISGNTISEGRGAGIWGEGVSDAQIINSTITENVSTVLASSSALYLNGGTFTLKNSIIYGNTTYSNINIENYSPTVNAYNSILRDLDGVNGINSNNSTSDPLLQSLSDNGGYSFTHALGAGSAAIDGGLTGTEIYEIDQRGYLRDDSPDIGAYEYLGVLDSANPTAVFLPVDDANDVALSSNLTITFDEAVDAEIGHITLYKSGGIQVEQFDVTSDITGSGTETITINPTFDFEYSTGYYVEIDTIAFDDVAGNSYAGISDDTLWTFTTLDTPICPSISNASTYNSYPTCGVATCNDGYILSDGACVAQGGGSFIPPTPPIVIQTPQFKTIGADITFEVDNVEMIAISETEGFKGVSWQLYVDSFKNSDKTLYIKFRSKEGGTSKVFIVESEKTSVKNVVKEKAPTVKVKVEKEIPKEVKKVLFTKNLELGMKGESVRELQKYLNNHGFLVDTQGLGSSGQETIYFGNLTRKALVKFQKSVNLPAYGYFGPMTRGLIN